ncbi:head GIN domain-containing protein [Sphingobacterium sp. UBA1498]|uniref:head GIN domain-containing protein n=1 Tax=Sphingobacterium sp. UBA1498 TaxID=1947481 RepID=UPI0025EA5CFC|nr:head GIN domain-containing protein [Sphingobacterium sp. UBA1498]
MKFLGVSVILLLMAQVSFGQIKQNVGDFSSVLATDKIQVELIKSNESLVTFEGQNHENVKVVNTNGSLVLKMNTLNMLQGGNISVKVYYKTLGNVEAKKGAKVFATTDNTISADHLKVYASEGGLVDLYADVKTAEIKVTSGATIALYGKANKQEIISNFGGKYEGKDFKTSTTMVTVNGGGKADVYAADSIETKTRGGGIIDVYGKPEQRVEKKMAGGTVNFK